MCVCVQNEPAKTATGIIARSSSSTDHTASTNTNHHSTGRYGFHGSVEQVRAVRVRQHREHRGDAEQQPDDRRAVDAIHSESPIATMSSATSEANRPYDEPPNSFHTGHSA